MKPKVKILSIFQIAVPLLLMLLLASFMVPQGKVKKHRTPFILRLPDRAAEKEMTILDSTKSVWMRSGLVILQPGESVGSHNTHDNEELLVILDGAGEIEAERLGKEKVTAGMVAYMPPHNQHNVHCTGTAPLKYIYIVSKAK